MTDTTSPEFFEHLYSEHSDPWNFASSPYETSRYEATIKALESRKFLRIIEPGCSIGVLTEKLAFHADSVEASDISPTAVKQARIRCQHLPNVHISLAPFNIHLPADKPFDLLVLSEIGYYFAEPVLIETSQSLVDQLQKAGTLLAVHWLGHSKDHVLSGDRVHEILLQLAGLHHQYSERHPEFRLDRWQKL